MKYRQINQAELDAEAAHNAIRIVRNLLATAPSMRANAVDRIPGYLMTIEEKIADIRRLLSMTEEEREQEEYERAYGR